ncbi:type II toxin-antitoxin system PemK/MazF family toxin [candidate division KSB1 bacterium]|nr:MAG: type II toxin-antitoxin system PemK/MazF family toxin [candidate division KSB1 bacterium]
MPSPHRGEVYLVNLDPTIGSEIKKTRPAVIIQNDVGNQYSPITIIAPITSGDKAVYPVEVEVKKSEGGLDNNSLILLNQIRTVDQQRLVKRLGRLDDQTMGKVDQAIMISLGLIKI